MVSYAMPTASVLLLELYRLARQPQQPHILPRSTIIKDISALITCCDWFTESGQGNFALCKRAQAIFSRGLDQILDDAYPAAPLPAEGTNHEVVQQQHNPAMNANLNPNEGFVDDPDWTAWLQSFGLDGVTNFDAFANDFDTNM